MALLSAGVLAVHFWWIITKGNRSTIWSLLPLGQQKEQLNSFPFWLLRLFWQSTIIAVQHYLQRWWCCFGFLERGAFEHLYWREEYVTVEGKLEFLCRLAFSDITLVVKSKFFIRMKIKTYSPLHQPSLFCLQAWPASWGKSAKKKYPNKKRWFSNEQLRWTWRILLAVNTSRIWDCVKFWSGLKNIIIYTHHLW